MWLSGNTSSADLQSDMMRSGATFAARTVAARAAETACRELDAFPPTPAREHLRDLSAQTVSR
jgi:geranylgeranyl pyrophosphate synthase